MGIWMQSQNTGRSGVRKSVFREFPAGPVVRTPNFHCKRHRFDLQSGKFHTLWSQKKKKNGKKKKHNGGYLIIHLVSRCALNTDYTSEVALGLHIVMRVPTLMKPIIC